MILDEVTAEVADRRNKEKDSEKIGNKTRNKQDACHDHHDAVGNFAAGVLSRLNLFSDLRENADSLDAEQNPADNTAQHHQTDGRHHAYLFADDHETRDLDQRKGKENKREREQFVSLRAARVKGNV